MTTSRLLAGASGDPFKEWKGNFYPEKIKAEEMLAFYAERLPTVEINNTFYRMPKTAVLENWAGTTPEGFRFAIKGVTPHHAYRAHQDGNGRRAAGLSLPEPGGARRQTRPGAVPAAAEPEKGLAAPRGVSEPPPRRT